jgi:putative membrane protein
MQSALYDPYCGPGPVPASLWTSWNFDPFFLGVLAVGLVVWCYAGRGDKTGGSCLFAAYALVVVAFISPLCALSSALFSARVAHHLILIAGIAPLLAIAFPPRKRPLLPLSVLVALHAVIVWFWHAPGPYAFALSSHSAYWLTQATLFVSAWMLWREVFAPRNHKVGVVLALLATIMQMGFLGALLVFASRPLFVPHFTTTQAFGMTPLEDQQLSGLLMWVPAFLPYAGVALYQFLSLILPQQQSSTYR